MKTTTGIVDGQSHLFCPEQLALTERPDRDPVVRVKDGVRTVIMGDWHRKVLPNHSDQAALLGDMDAMLKHLESLRSDRRVASPCALALTLACCWFVGCATIVPPNSSYSHSLDVPENRAMQPLPDNPSLPRVLLIGDSISIGYTLPVREQLQDTANVQRIPENGSSTTLGLAKLEAWLGTSQWDVIHFNWGLHDLKLQPDGRHLVPVAEYEQNLRKLVERLQRTGAILIWATTTPVPPAVKGPARNPADVALYNEAALRVMRAADARINDLHGFALARLPSIQVPHNVHFTAEGSTQLAQQVVRTIRGALRHRHIAP